MSDNGPCISFNYDVPITTHDKSKKDFISAIANQLEDTCLGDSVCQDCRTCLTKFNKTEFEQQFQGYYTCVYGTHYVDPTNPLNNSAIIGIIVAVGFFIFVSTLTTIWYINKS